MEETLKKYQQITIKALLSQVPEKEPRKYLYNLIPSYPSRSGKGLRPGLCIGTCLAFGGEISAVLQSAVAIELFHNAFLVHDDVEDGSEIRRGKPTLHAQHGVAIAVNVGDAMNVLTMAPLMENLYVLGPTVTWEIFREVQHMVTAAVEGQAMELGWVRDNSVGLVEQDYLRMILKKTCWYTCIHPCRVGALVARREAAGLDTFNKFGFYMGAAFQIKDDVLNLVGSRKKYGKEIRGDIQEGKRTLILINLLNSCTSQERQRCEDFLAKPRKNRSKEEVNWVYRMMVKYDCIEYAKQCARDLAEGALEEFKVVYGALPESIHKTFVECLVTYMIERDL